MNVNTDRTGNTAPVSPDSNLVVGVIISNSTGLDFGTPGKGNIVVGHTHNVNFLNIHHAYILGNIIGLNARTDAAILPGSQRTGMHFVEGSDIHIGGPNPGEGNVISGHQSTDPGDSGEGEGITMSNLDGVTIEGNFIGTDKTGSVDFGNNTQGIEICSTSNPCGITISMNKNVYIGGSSAGQRNIISGNGGEGILFSGTDNLNIQGNYIGVAGDGLSALGNRTGIQGKTLGTNTLIGGPNPGERNIISFNGGHGIFINQVSDVSIIKNIISENERGIGIRESTGITITKNIIGFLADGITPAGNALFGMFIEGSDNIHIGSSDSADRNYIGNSGFVGILLKNTGTDITLTKNNIGVGSDDTTAGPNASGILSVNAGSGNALIQENRIVNSISDGVLIENSSVFGPIPPTSGSVSLVNNNISNNGGLGINIAQDLTGGFGDHDGDPFTPDIPMGDGIPDTDTGPNLNDLGDTDAGVNDYLNYPVINKVVETTPGNLDIYYYLDVPAGTYRVELYKNPTNGLDPSFHGEGETLVYVDTVTTAGGMTNHHIPVTIAGTVADVITATATQDLGGSYGKTSEFGTTVPGTGSGSAAGIDTGNTSILAPANGAYHVLGTNYLGSCVNADNDDTTSIPGIFVGTGPCTSDNDGLTLAAYYNAGDAVTLAPTMSAPGIINVWIDYNNDGDYLDIGEHVINQNTIGAIPSFTVPPATPNGSYPLRIRYVSDIGKISTVVPGEASPLGEALDGEAEDYVFRVGAPSVPSAPPSGGAPAGSTSGGAPAACRDPKASNYRAVGAHDPLLCAYGGAPAQPKTAALLNTGTSAALDQKACPYFTQYLRSGARNSRAEVTRWQNFLNEILGLKLKVNGTYDRATVNAVNRFQLLFAPDVLTPWGLGKPTGYTYKTTRMKANQMVNCPDSPVTLEGSGNGKTWVLPALR